MKNPLLLILTICFSSPLIAQERKADLQAPMDLKSRGGNDLIIDGGYTVEELVLDFFANSCVTPFNIKLVGDPNGMAFFQGANTDLNLPAGIVIASGNVSNIHGPNNMQGAGNSFGQAGDPDLDILTGQTTFDATIIEFDFISSNPNLSFKYIFGSEEYPEYVCAYFNDVFGFFISGPEITGLYSNGAKNIALIPNTPIGVGINSVNSGIPGGLVSPGCYLNYFQYYIDNTGGTDLQYDGYTTPLDAKVTVIPGEIYHAKIAVSDAGDGIFDSGVFISVESLCGDSLLTPIASLSVSHPEKDLATFKGQVKYSYNDWILDFGDGQQTVIDGPVTHLYTSPGIYTATISGTNYCCTGTASYDIYIQQPPFINKAVSTLPSCFDSQDGQIELDIQSSIGGLTYTWSDGGTGAIRTGLGAGSYTVTIEDADGNVTISPIYNLEVVPLEVVIQMSNPVSKSKVVHLNISGGHAPYTIHWEDGRTETKRSDLILGKTYSVQVTDSRGCVEFITFDYGKNTAVHLSNMFVSPNPANAQLRVVVEHSAKETGIIQIYDLLGKCMHEQIVSGFDTLELPIGSWPDGIYLLHYQYEGGAETRQVFIRH